MRERNDKESEADLKRPPYDELATLLIAARQQDTIKSTLIYLANLSPPQLEKTLKPFRLRKPKRPGQEKIFTKAGVEGLLRLVELAKPCLEERMQEKLTEAKFLRIIYVLTLSMDPDGIRREPPVEIPLPTKAQRRTAETSADAKKFAKTMANHLADARAARKKPP